MAHGRIGGGLFVGGYQGSTGRGTLTLTGGQISNVACNIGISYGSVGSATVNGGVWSGSSALTVANLGMGSLDITGGLVSSVSGAIGSGTIGTSVLAHAISGSGTVRVAGPGRLAVTGTSSYSGPTEVAGGALLVSGALGDTAVTVNAGGLLGGSGSVSGPVAAGAGGTIAPGASIESLAIGSLSLLDASAFDVEIDSSAPAAVAADFLRVTDDLTLTGTTGLTVTDLALTPASFGPGLTLSLIN